LCRRPRTNPELPPTRCSLSRQRRFKSGNEAKQRDTATAPPLSPSTSDASFSLLPIDLGVNREDAMKSPGPPAPPAYPRSPLAAVNLKQEVGSYAQSCVCMCSRPTLAVLLK
jgi:hypothetical protein